MGIINDRIRERRTALGLTLLEVAEFLGVKEATAQRYESGAIKSIGHETVVKLAELLKCDPSYLMGWSSSSELVVSSKSVNETFSLSPLEREIVLKFRKLTNGERDMFLRSLGIEEKGDVAKMA